MEPWVGEWTPRVEVNSYDPTGWYFKLEHGGLSSIFTGAIEQGHSRRVVLQGSYKFQQRAYLKTYYADVFGRLVTQDTVENAIRKIGYTGVNRYSAWGSGRLQADAFRNLKDVPFVSFITSWSRELSEIINASLVQRPLRHG